MHLKENPVFFQDLVSLKKCFIKADSFVSLSEAVQMLEAYVFSEPRLEIENKGLSFFNAYYAKWEKMLEHIHVQNILENSGGFDNSYPLFARFQRLITKEMDLLANYPKPSNMLFIGGGPFPISPLIYVSQYNLQAAAIDNDAEACIVSRQVIEKIGFSERLHIHSGKGETYKIEPYDLVVVALLALPKQEILDNLYQRLKPGTPVIFRIAEGARKLIYFSLDRHEIKGWRIAGHQSAQYDDTISSLLLFRNED